MEIVSLETLKNMRTDLVVAMVLRQKKKMRVYVDGELYALADYDIEVFKGGEHKKPRVEKLELVLAEVFTQNAVALKVKLL